MTLAPKRRWFRWSLRSMFVVVTVICVALVSLAPKRRWLTYSLRTLFVVVTVVAIGLGIRANWRPNWIHQRHMLLERQAAKAEKYRGWKMSMLNAPDSSSVPVTPGAYSRQWPKKLTRAVLWVFDEPSMPEVRLYGNVFTHLGFYVQFKEIEQAQWLFPEADIRICVMAQP